MKRLPRVRVSRYTMKKKRASIGIDIGGTKSLYALLDEDFEVVAEEKLRTRSVEGTLKKFERCQAKAIKSLMREARRRRLEVEVVGVGVAGQVDMRTGVVKAAPNLAFLEGYPFGDRLESLTGAPVFVSNDVHAALYGEHELGAARKARHVIGVWIGTGVGGALLIDGRLHLGASGIAGDIGNYLLHPVDTALDAPRKEVIDNIASRTAIAGDAAALASKRASSKLARIAGTDVKDITSGNIAKAIKLGDKAVEKLLRSRAAVLGAAISNLVDFLNPDMVVLGGGLVEALPKLLRREVARSIKAHATPKAAADVEVVVAKLNKHAGTAGAAKLAYDMFNEKRPPIDLASTAA
jgi:glucokinase